MNGKVNLIILSILMLVVLVGAVVCSDKNAECKVTFDRQGNLDIIANPPGAPVIVAGEK
jgi:hypothetical protein